MEIFEKLWVADIIPEKENRDIIALGYPVQIRFGYSVEYNLVVTDIRKMTFKKDDKTVLSLYFMDETNTLFLLRVKTDASKELLEDIQIMIEDYSN